jgi:hypothetical protein
MRFLPPALDFSPLSSRTEHDKSFFNVFVERESIEARFDRALLTRTGLRAAWFVLLARYAQLDSLEVVTAGSTAKAATSLTSTCSRCSGRNQGIARY